MQRLQLSWPFVRDDSFYDTELFTCACTKHPSGNPMAPSLTCGTCRGTGMTPVEIHPDYFDGHGNLISSSESGLKSPWAEEDTAIHVRF